MLLRDTECPFFNRAPTLRPLAGPFYFQRKKYLDLIFGDVGRIQKVRFQQEAITWLEFLLHNQPYWTIFHNSFNGKGTHVRIESCYSTLYISNDASQTKYVW